MVGRKKNSPRRPPSYWKRHRDQKCDCGGYHFPHRIKGGACYHSPRADYYHALRAGVPLKEAMELLSAADLERMSPLT